MDSLNTHIFSFCKFNIHIECGTKQVHCKFGQLQLYPTFFFSKKLKFVHISFEVCACDCMLNITCNFYSYKETFFRVFFFQEPFDEVNFMKLQAAYLNLAPSMGHRKCREEMFCQALNFYQIFHRFTLDFANTPFQVLKAWNVAYKNMKICWGAAKHPTSNKHRVILHSMTAPTKWWEMWLTQARIYFSATNRIWPPTFQHNSSHQVNKSEAYVFWSKIKLTENCIDWDNLV